MIVSWLKISLHDGFRTTPLVVWVGLGRRITEIMNDRSNVISRLIDNAVAQITETPPAGRANLELRNCLRCASPIGVRGCIGCESKMPNNRLYPGQNIPIPRSVVVWLEANYNIALDPAAAWQREECMADRWANEQRSERMLGGRRHS